MNSDDIINPAKQAGRTLADSASQVWGNTKVKAGEVADRSGRLVREHPTTTVLSVCGLGFLLGLAVGWSVSRTEAEQRCVCAYKFFKRWGHKLSFD
jgi:hypothetical protein